MHTWLLLLYKVPPEPSARRVYVWRKLKRLGAILLHDAVWVLPATARTLEQFQWLAAEIVEMGGEATLWQSHLAMPGQDEALVRQFQAQVEAAYGEILTALVGEDADVAVLSRRYQQLLAQDHFQSEIGQRVRMALLAASGKGGNAS